jgi:Protein of unknown function (DUF2442)
MEKRSRKSDRLVRLLSVRPLGDYRLELGLTNGTKITRDLSSFVGSAKGVLERLRDRKFFARARISHGTLEWPGGIDICPDVIQKRAP